MNLTDYQVLTLVREHPGANLYQLLKAAKKDMSKWGWSIGKIQRSVQRLASAKKVETDMAFQGGRASVCVRLRQSKI